MGSMVDYSSLLNLHGSESDAAHLQSALDVQQSPIHPEHIQLHHPSDAILDDAGQSVHDHIQEHHPLTMHHQMVQVLPSTSQNDDLLCCIEPRLCDHYK